MPMKVVKSGIYWLIAKNYHSPTSVQGKAGLFGRVQGSSAPACHMLASVSLISGCGLQSRYMQGLLTHRARCGTDNSPWDWTWRWINPNNS